LRNVKRRTWRSWWRVNHQHRYHERWKMENRQCWCTIFLGTRRAWYWVCRVCWRI
jgi:hypothetical protein